MFIRILEIIFPILAIVMVGLIYGRTRQLDMEIVGRINLHIFIPCLIFSVFIRQPIEAVSDAWLLLAAILMHIIPGLLALPLIWISRQPLRAIMPPVIFANAGNLGLPLFVFAFGDEALAPAVVLFLVMNILQFSVGVRILDRQVRWLSLVSQPVLVAALLAIIYQWSSVRLPEVLLTPIGMLGQVAVPLMLFSLGISLAEGRFFEWRLGLTTAVLIPAVGVLSALIIAWILPLGELQQRMLILYGALPPAVLTFIFAERYNQEPAKVAAVVMIGNMAALLTVPATLFFILP